MGKSFNDRSSVVKGPNINLSNLLSDSDIIILSKIAGLKSNPLVAAVKVEYGNFIGGKLTIKRYDVFLRQKIPNNKIEDITNSLGLREPISVLHCEGHSYFRFGNQNTEYILRFH